MLLHWLYISAFRDRMSVLHNRSVLQVCTRDSWHGNLFRVPTCHFPWPPHYHRLVTENWSLQFFNSAINKILVFVANHAFLCLYCTLSTCITFLIFTNTFPCPSLGGALAEVTSLSRSELEDLLECEDKMAALVESMPPLATIRAQCDSLASQNEALASESHNVE